MVPIFTFSLVSEKLGVLMPCGNTESAYVRAVTRRQGWDGGCGASPALGAQAPGTLSFLQPFLPPGGGKPHRAASAPANREGGLLLYPHAAELGARPT